MLYNDAETLSINIIIMKIKSPIYITIYALVLFEIIAEHYYHDI